VMFDFGALKYAKHPEGVLEFQKRKGTQRFERLFFSGDKDKSDKMGTIGTPASASASASGANG
jgi:hypothetical protein